MNEVIQCENVHRTYNPSQPCEVKALVDVSLAIKRGSFSLLRGPSGSGKTTLLGLLGALDRPSKGRITLDGIDLGKCSGETLAELRQKRIGFVFQNFNLLSRLPAWENVALPLVPLGMPEKDRKTKALVLLEKLGLAERAHHAPEQMSGGEQQRTAIARALVNDPDIIILDEPTSNIDRSAAEQLVNALADLLEEHKTIIVSSHDEALYPWADRIFELRYGALSAAL
jgi:putative ABC transport system ATP-binding protein